MAIAYDALTYASGSGISSKTFSHTNNGNLVILGVYHYKPGNTSDLMTGATYGGQAMTRVNTTVESTNANERCYLYILANAPTGANDFVASFSTTVTPELHGVSYSGCATTGQPDGQITANNNSNSTSCTITSTANNCWMVAFARSQNNWSSGGGSGTTDRSISAHGNNGICDSNQAITPAGSYTLTINWTGTDTNGMCSCTIAPTPPPPVGKLYRINQAVNRASTY